jgi:hypothetical protein
VQMRLDLDLFDDAQTRIALHRVTGAAGAQIFEGEVEGVPESSVTLSVLDGQLFGNVKTPDFWYQVRSLDGGLHAIVEMDERRLGPESEPLLRDAATAGEPAVAAETEALADDGSLIDLLVMYTPSAKTEAGGATAINNLILTSVAETNMAFGRSGVNHRVRLVHAAETANWTHNGNPVNADDFDFLTAITMLKSPSDGKMDAAHTLRDTFGADAVVLLLDRTELCGRGYLMGPDDVNASFAPWAFSVTHWECASGNYTFGHELGHNMGLMHDRANSDQTPAFPYGYGWGDPAGQFRDIMAYECPTTAGSCRKILNYSNPTVLHNGAPTGAPVGSPGAAHGAQALNNISVTFANFRATVVPVCRYTIAPSTVAIPASGATGTISVTTTAGCSWSATSTASWLTITGGASGSGTGAITYTAPANLDPQRVARIFVGGEMLTVTQAAGAPTGVVATAISDEDVLVTWNAFPGAVHYEIERKEVGWDDWFAVGFSEETSFEDWFLEANKAYLYRVRAVLGSRTTAGSAPDLVTMIPWINDPLVPRGTLIKASHLVQTRTAVNAVRELAGLAPVTFADSILKGTPVKGSHVADLRTGLDAALALLALPPALYDTAPAAGLPVPAIHLQQIRDLVK